MRLVSVSPGPCTLYIVGLSCAFPNFENTAFLPLDFTKFLGMKDPFFEAILRMFCLKKLGPLPNFSLK